MGIRYDNRGKKTNSAEIHEKLLESRDSQGIAQYSTPEFEPISLDTRYSLENIHHVWSVGDSYWKLANQHYGDSGLWWLIAWYNKKPTESHVKIGDSMAIPLPIERALKFFNR